MQWYGSPEDEGLHGGQRDILFIAVEDLTVRRVHDALPQLVLDAHARRLQGQKDYRRQHTTIRINKKDKMEFQN